jgi:hypothetical protein
MCSTAILVPQWQERDARARRTDHGQDARATVGRGPQKKECLISTNEAIMLLKTKDRQNERSQTKPISAGGEIGCAEKAMLNYEF